MKYRYTVEVLDSGQPRAYADTIYHVRVTLEMMPNGHLYDKWGPYPQPSGEIAEETLFDLLKGLRCGFTDFKYDPKVHTSTNDYYRTRLDWIKMVKPGVWEFHTSAKYTG